MKKLNYKVLNIAVISLTIIIFGGILFFQSGILRKDPKIAITPDNCYKETLTVITDADYSPYSFYDENGEYSGHDVELITMIANELKMNLDIKLMNWYEAIDAMNAGKADVLMTCDYSDTFAGVDRLTKCEPVSFDDFIVYSKERITSSDELYGKRIAIMRNGNVSAQIDMMNLNQHCILYDDNRKAMQALIDGEADCAIMRQTVGAVLLQELKANEIEGYIGIGQSFMCFGVADDELAAKINTAIETLKMSGKLNQLHEKWLTTFIKPYTFREVMQNNLWVEIIFVLLLITAISFIAFGIMRKKKEAEDMLHSEQKHQVELQKALDASNFEIQRNSVLINIIGGGVFNYGISAAGEIVSAHYSEMSQDRIDKAFTAEPTAWFELLHPDDKESVINAFMACIHDQTGKTAYDETFRIMGKNGKYRWVKSGGNILLHKDGSSEFYGISVDITEQMEEQQKRLLGAVALSPDVLNKANIGLWAFELDEGQPPRMYGDETMLSLVGLDHQVPPEEMYHAWYDHIDGDSYGIVTDAVEKMSSGEHAEVQYPWHHPDGHTVIVRCGGVRNFEYKKGIRIEGTHQDVSATLHYDAKNRERNLKLISGFAKEYEGVFLANMTDLSFRVINDKIDINPEILSLPNYAEASRRFAEEYVYPDDRALFSSEIFDPEIAKRMMPEGESRSFEYRSILGSEYVWHKAVFTRISEDEVLLGFKNCSNEILAKHVNEKVIADFASVFIVNLNDDTFRFISRNSESGFKDVPGGIYSDTIIEYTSRVNPKYQEQWKKFCSVDYVRDALTKEDKIEYVYPLEGVEKRWRRCILQTLETTHGVPSSFIMTYFTIDDASASNLELSEKIAVQNVKLAKQQEQLEDALGLARKASKAKTEFLFNMSHDIRTPMNAILGYTDIGIRHIDDEETVQDSLIKIKTAGGHLLSLINDILEMSRIESGTFDLIESPLDIREAIAGVEQMGNSLAIAKSIDLKVEIGELKNQYIYADELHTNEVIINLISNAVKYTPQGGKVTYFIDQLGDVTDGKARFRFSVKDNGIGMSEEFQTHLFEAFSREKSSTVSKIEGTGIGLSIVKKIVEMAGGSITVNSALGEGSTFIVEMPFRVMDDAAIAEFKALNKEPENDVVTEINLKGKKVLLVEDNEMNREIATELLEETGLIVDDAEDGKIAVNKVTEKGVDYYDFILMDIQMPVMNGFEATEAIRALPNGSDVTIIALSANAFEEDKQKSIEAGMNDHVAKPINIKELFGVLAKYL